MRCAWRRSFIAAERRSAAPLLRLGLFANRAFAVPATVPGPARKPMPFNPLQDTAFHALSHAYSIGYLICGIAALAAALLAVTAVRGRASETLLDPQALADE